MRSTMSRVATTTTTTPAPVNYTDANLVETEIKQALSEYYESMLDNLLEFNQVTREYFNSEIGRIFEELEKDEFYNLYEGKCQPDQLTTFDEYQSSLDAFIKVSLEHELKRIEDSALTSFNKFYAPFQEYVKASLITPLTTALRFNKVPKSVAIPCANYYVPLIIDFIENGYLGVMDCYNLTIYYNETYEYQEIINSLYRETASYLTTCTNTACFKKVSEKQKFRNYCKKHFYRFAGKHICSSFAQPKLLAMQCPRFMQI